MSGQIGNKGNHKATGKKSTLPLSIEIDLDSIESTTLSFQKILEAYMSNRLREKRFTRFVYGIERYIV
jgi:hypothetical protein